MILSTFTLVLWLKTSSWLWLYFLMFSWNTSFLSQYLYTWFQLYPYFTCMCAGQLQANFWLCTHTSDILVSQNLDKRFIQVKEDIICHFAQGDTLSWHLNEVSVGQNNTRRQYVSSFSTLSCFWGVKWATQLHSSPLSFLDTILSGVMYWTGSFSQNTMLQNVIGNHQVYIPFKAIRKYCNYSDRHWLHKPMGFTVTPYLCVLSFKRLTLRTVAYMAFFSP